MRRKMKLVLVALVAAVRGDDYCPDDPDWHKSNKPSRDCAWVGENVPTRCTIKGEDKAYSYASCQVQCQGAARSCGGDSTSWFKNGNPSKDCDWARAGAAVLGPRAERESAARDGRDHASAAQVSKSPSARCDVVGKDGTVAGQACASSCVVPCAGSHTYETISSLYNIGYGCTSVDELDLSDARPRRPKQMRRVAPARPRLGRDRVLPSPRKRSSLGAGGLRPGGRRVHRHHRGRPGPRRQRHAPGLVRLRRAHAHRRRLHRLGVLGAADDLGLRQAPVRRRTDGRPARPQPERRVHLGLRRPRGRRGLARHRDDAVADDGARAPPAARGGRARAPRRRAPTGRRPTAARRRCSAT